MNENDLVPRQMTTGLAHCPRCHKPHHMPIVFIAMKHPIVVAGQTWNYYGTCITTSAPILMRFAPDAPIETDTAGQ